jgi:hypothetical protein
MQAIASSPSRERRLGDRDPYRTRQPRSRWRDPLSLRRATLGPDPKRPGMRGKRDSAAGTVCTFLASAWAGHARIPLIGGVRIGSVATGNRRPPQRAWRGSGRAPRRQSNHPPDRPANRKAITASPAGVPIMRNKRMLVGSRDHALDVPCSVGSWKASVVMSAPLGRAA